MSRLRPDDRPLVIVDNNLVDDRGHHLALARTLANQALAEGRAVHLYAHRNFADTDLDPRIAVHRVFDTSIYEIMAQKRTDVDLSPDFEAVFHKVAADHGASGALVLMHTCDAHVYRAFARWIDSARFRDTRGIVWHLCTCYEIRLLPGLAVRAEPVPAQIWKIARAPETGRRIFLWGETERLAEYYQRQFRVSAEPLPLPTPQWISEPAACGVAAREGVTLVYLGAAREEKGFLELVPLAEAIMADPGLAGKAVLRIQCSAPLAGYNRPSAAAVEKLSGYACCELVHGPLGVAEFARELLSADIVWAKYRPKNYFARGSGLVMEAFSAGKHILYSPGMFVERMNDKGLALPVRTIDDCIAELRAFTLYSQTRRAAGAVIGRTMAERYSAAAYLRRMTRREGCGALLRNLSPVGSAPSLPILVRPSPGSVGRI